LFSAVVLATVFGCIPAYHTYWAPAAEGGRLTLSVRGSLAAKDQIEFLFDDVRVIIYGSGKSMGGVIIPKNDRSASFVSDEAELRDIETLAITKAKVHGMVVDASLTKMIDRSATDTITGWGDELYFRVSFEGPEKLRYSIKLPALKVDAQVYDVPTIEFTKKEGFAVYPINN
jgi:hypothetical protein